MGVYKKIVFYFPNGSNYSPYFREKNHLVLANGKQLVGMIKFWNLLGYETVN